MLGGNSASCHLAFDKSIPVVTFKFVLPWRGAGAYNARLAWLLLEEYISCAPSDSPFSQFVYFTREREENCPLTGEWDDKTAMKRSLVWCEIDRARQDTICVYVIIVVCFSA